MTGPTRASRLDGLTSWHATGWRGLRVAVLGLGATGFSVADTLVELGSEVTVWSEDAPEDRVELLGVIGARFVRTSLATVPDELVVAAPDLVVASPGLPPSNPTLAWAVEHSTVWGDIELAWRVRDKVVRPSGPAPWVLITGTNGKTTTTQLTQAMYAAGGWRAAACGNIGVPVLDVVRDPDGYDVLVVELSSHQLHSMPTTGPGAVVPLASTCLNLADDHLEWHGSAAAYRDAKAKVYANTVVACVYNVVDEATRRMVEDADVVEGCRAVGFTAGVPAPGDVGVVEDVLCDRAFLDDRRNAALELAAQADLELAGLASPHMTMNVLAAAALARAGGVTPADIRQAVRGFRPDHHRTELVAVADGVRWVDDSKATNPHAATASLAAFEDVVWIVGGLFKGVDVDDLVARFGPEVRAAVVIGTDRAPVLAAFARHAPDVPLVEVLASDTEQVMPEAVRHAAAVARPGDTVLLAPAAASFDQFGSYADRGRRFAAAVHEHLGGDADGEPADDRPHGDDPDRGR
ncbi:UDP-N-acetylmuramoyl-L-alanine--D-glutamate ligase [Curtobacterium sp. MCBD17_034]|uniref:UDP-N-acetylmuramoyl-L-alanine--D-glutamate ligase n=1 Tax=unclassified Curtobacterium TaxID=257496 RepID=UPI000DA97593|nr:MULTISPECIES: UDP-N-acetylmuramoyl-L-alanine--D-glutamate ligase [unclassified Curtobacterium]PZE74540.1 UDP-N-acetylmuramoyl-L-alanine--D-glutamate ligase [Curtobacterium sp. MCBD17_019]PZF61043.1 UDP-N-acetylmuramoyl-L-alanine--D-glutamate ligase [Curtobacterium sp. MCBD17_034]PZM40393.1 UDP-N-acetylmuramoyl-L-alanine--D-glutamate ligase [Curtobacterium sp. MCBD17_031]WIE55806.1 UDP-N-acetylmuramoyl-L-alanine--D-glutamate ligase [Curtobacterium sp. MCBD17_003]